MQRCNFFRSPKSILLAFLLLALFFPTQSSQSSQAQSKIKSAKPMSRRQILELLMEEVDVRDIQKKAPQISLKNLLQSLQAELRAKRIELPIGVNKEQFMLENPDAPDILETEITLSDVHPRRMTIARLLHIGFSKVPTRNATFLARRGVLEITTDDDVNYGLLRRRVVVKFSKVPFRAAIEELSEQTGANLIIDPRIGKNADTKVTIFLGNQTLREAVVILCNLAEVRPAYLAGTIVFTTAKNARRLERSQMELMQFSPPGLQANPRRVPQLVPISAERK